MAVQRTFVLVHGAWHGGWCFARVAPLLRAAGHRVFTPTLTGLGERSHLFSGAITLDTHITDIVNTLGYEDLHDVTLCGHSYGGFVISGVIDRVPERIGALVFLDAIVPNDGESFVDVAGGAGLSPHIVGAMAHGGLAIPPIPAKRFNVNAADQALVDGLCGPQPVGTMLQRLHLGDARDLCKKKTYIRAAGYPSAMFDRYRAQCAADSSWAVFDLPCGHDVMLDMPEALAELLLA